MSEEEAEMRERVMVSVVEAQGLLIVNCVMICLLLNSNWFILRTDSSK